MTGSRECSQAKKRPQQISGVQQLGLFHSRPFSSRKTMASCMPRIAKQYKCHHCYSCKNYRGKGMEGGKKCLCIGFFADQKIMSSWKKCILGHSVA